MRLVMNSALAIAGALAGSLAGPAFYSGPAPRRTEGTILAPPPARQKGKARRPAGSYRGARRNLARTVLHMNPGASWPTVWARIRDLPHNAFVPARPDYGRALADAQARQRGENIDGTPRRETVLVEDRPEGLPPGLAEPSPAEIVEAAAEPVAAVDLTPEMKLVAVLGSAGKVGLTAADLAAVLGLSVQKVGAMLKAAVVKGSVRDSGAKSPSKAAIWIAA